MEEIQIDSWNLELHDVEEVVDNNATIEEQWHGNVGVMGQKPIFVKEQSESGGVQRMREETVILSDRDLQPMSYNKDDEKDNLAKRIGGKTCCCRGDTFGARLWSLSSISPLFRFTDLRK
jgi:hypothetical protein